MKTADEALSREIERGMTREDVLRRAAALGIVISAGTLGPLTEAAFASSQIKRGGTFRQATAGGTTDFIDGQHIVAKSDIVRLVATLRGSGPLRREGQDSAPSRRGAQGGEGQSVPHPRQARASSSTTARRSTIDDVIYSIKRTKNPKLKLFGNAAVRRDRPEPHQEARQVDLSDLPVAAETSRSWRRSRSTSRASSRRGTSRPPSARARCSTSGPGPSRSRASRPAARAST